MRKNVLTKRPPNLVYAVDEVPPFGKLILLGLQQVFVISIYFVYITILAKLAGASNELTIQLVSLGMIVVGIAPMLQALTKGPVGSGYLVPSVNSAMYLKASILAVSLGGLPLMLGLTVIAGAFEMLLSQIFRYFRKVFTPTVSGFIVMVVGIEVGIIGIKQMLDIQEGLKSVHFIPHLSVSFFTLSFMLALSIWGKGKARLFSPMIGIILGTILAYFSGLVSPGIIEDVRRTPFFALPKLISFSYSFDWMVLVPFLISGLAASLRAAGVVTTAQKINDLNWKRPSFASIEKGVLADGISCTLGGLIGVPGISAGPSCVGISQATGATSRYIAYSIGGILFFLACFPKSGAIFMLIPHAVIGGALMYTGSIMMIGGIKIITNHPINLRKTFIIALSLLFGLSRELYPDFYVTLPKGVQFFTSTMLSIATFSAVFLTAIFRIGIRKKLETVIEDSTSSIEGFGDLVRQKSKEWETEGEYVERAIQAATNVFTILHEGNYSDSPIETSFIFDEESFIIEITYSGELLRLPQNRPESEQDLLDESPMSTGLKGFLAGIYPDKVTSKTEETLCHIQLTYQL